MATDLVLKEEPQLISAKFVTHHPKAGINPLVDAAAYLFSVIGKLKLLKSYPHLNHLQKDLVEEITRFQEQTKALGYSSDFILVSRYALCVTLDDIIVNTAWAAQIQWNPYKLQTFFNNSEPPTYDRFFLILDKISQEPAVYIDLMEFMYICLSLGFKGNYRTSEFGNSQLEQITDGLYRRIRNHHVNFSKTLSPFSFKPFSDKKNNVSRCSVLDVFGITLILILFTFVSLGYLLDFKEKNIHSDLTALGKIVHERSKI